MKVKGFKAHLIPLGVLSLTWAIAALIKSFQDDARRATAIRWLNGTYLAVAVGSVAIVTWRSCNDVRGLVQGVAGTYNRYSYLDEKRAALEAWGKLWTT